MSPEPSPCFLPTGPELEHGRCPRRSVNGDVGWMGWKYGGGEAVGGSGSWCQKGVKGGLGLSRKQKSRWRDKGTGGLGMAWGFDCSLLEPWQMKALCGTHKKEGAELSSQYFDFGDLFLVTLTLFWHKGLFLALNRGRNKTYLHFNHYNLEIFPECRGRLTPCCHRKLSLM